MIPFGVDFPFPRCHNWFSSRKSSLSPLQRLHCVIPKFFCHLWFVFKQLQFIYSKMVPGFLYYGRASNSWWMAPKSGFLFCPALAALLPNQRAKPKPLSFSCLVLVQSPCFVCSSHLLRGPYQNPFWQREGSGRAVLIIMTILCKTLYSFLQMNSMK